MAAGAVIAGAVNGIFGNVTKLIASSPNRIGRSIIRENEVDLYTNNDDLMSFLGSQNELLAGRQIDKNKTVDYSTTLLTLGVFAVIIILILNSNKLK